MSTIPHHCETAATIKQPRGKQNSVKKLVAPKATLVANSIDDADILAKGSDLGTVPEPVNSAPSPPHKQGHLKCQGDSKDLAAQIVEPVEKKKSKSQT
jgi:hypothetical protein